MWIKVNTFVPELSVVFHKLYCLLIYCLFISMPNNEITAIAANDKLLATETQPRKANASLICGTFTQFEVLGKLKLALFLQWTI